MTLEKKTARAMGAVALGFSLFFRAWVDGADPHSACLPLLASGLFSLPAALLVRSLSARRRTVPGALFPVYCLPLLYEGAHMAGFLTDCAAYSALSGLSRPLLLALTMGAVGLCAACGVSACAGASRLRLPLMGIMALLILVVQWHALRPAYLLPLSPVSAGALLREAAVLTGPQLLIAPLWLLSGDAACALSARRLGLAGAILAALFSAMLIPALPDAPASCAFRLDLLFSNGRAALPLQLAFALLAFSGLMTGACACLSMAAQLAHRAVPALRAPAAAALGAALEYAGALLLPRFAPPPWLLLALGMGPMLFTALRKGGDVP